MSMAINRRLVRATREVAAASRPGIAIARLLAASRAGEAIIGIDGSGGTRSVVARVVGALQPGDVGRQVAVMFEEGDPKRPLVLGVIGDWPAPDGRAERAAAAESPAEVVELDAESLLLSGRKQIVLRSGNASITLTRAGKLILHGKYASSRSTGVHRIRGGAVQVN
jgi:hypothetical protein